MKSLKLFSRIYRVWCDQKHHKLIFLLDIWIFLIVFLWKFNFIENCSRFLHGFLFQAKLLAKKLAIHREIPFKQENLGQNPDPRHEINQFVGINASERQRREVFQPISGGSSQSGVMNRNEIWGSKDEHYVRGHRLHHVADFLEANDLFLQILLLFL